MIAIHLNRHVYCRRYFKKAPALLVYKFSIQKLKIAKIKYSDTLYKKYNNKAENEL
ncbi:MAG: hypothetical protein UZ11_BCD004001796 [Bacteroidetes bacterium OLB11]|nr:MAG: hypothetical protein UZ11_BCD004001796 [Bacteroidetes bacterium OLB11]